VKSFPRRLATAAWVVLVLLFAWVSLLGCGEPLATPEAEYLQAAGSMSMKPVVAKLAAAFHERSPLVHLDVNGRGTQYGLHALSGNEIDLALASWLPEELDETWQITAIARDGIAVIVHPENPIDGLGLVQMQALFSGQVVEWRRLADNSMLGEVQLVSREDGAGDRAAFESLVLESRSAATSAIVVASDDAVVDFVAEHPNAVGYVSQTRVTPQVKVLRVESVLPTPDSIADGSYPIVRDWWLLSTGESDAVQHFVDWCLSPAGQEIIGRANGAVGP
jgi:phosphate transport system substrate-binding protein